MHTQTKCPNCKIWMVTLYARYAENNVQHWVSTPHMYCRLCGAHAVRKEDGEVLHDHAVATSVTKITRWMALSATECVSEAPQIDSVAL